MANQWYETRKGAGIMNGAHSAATGEDVYDMMERADVEVDTIPSSTYGAAEVAERNIQDDYKTVAGIVESAMHEGTDDAHEDGDLRTLVQRFSKDPSEDYADTGLPLTQYEDEAPQGMNGGTEEKMQLLSQCYEDAVTSGMESYAAMLEEKMQCLREGRSWHDTGNERYMTGD